MGSIENLAGVFFTAGQGFIDTFLNAGQGLFDIVSGSLQG
ncbi:Hypothetical protein BJL86_0110 [Dietzia timorensis]|uniref:Uncharacterized protein n=1 Tax=Dietzia timorensis TaxID=499555 RepID=A0A173LHI6_9ACTN|nr:Hypothetical protein BJL86_0110 [Dietzia timorensis]